MFGANAVLQMSVDVDGISAVLLHSQAPNASQQSLHAAAQAFEQVQTTHERRFRTPTFVTIFAQDEASNMHAGA